MARVGVTSGLRWVRPALFSADWQWTNPDRFYSTVCIDIIFTEVILYRFTVEMPAG